MAGPGRGLLSKACGTGRRWNCRIFRAVQGTGCAMVILLPWCDFPLPDVTFCIAAVPWGWCDFSRLMWLKHGARIRVTDNVSRSSGCVQQLSAWHEAFQGSDGSDDREVKMYAWWTKIRQEEETGSHLACNAHSGRVQSGARLTTSARSLGFTGLSENSVPLHPMVLLIIIPTKWLFHWGYTPFSDIPLHSLLSSEPRGLREQSWHGDRNQPRFCLWNPPLLEAGDAIAKDHRAKTKKLLVDKLCNDVVYKDVQGIFFQANQLL